MTVFKGRDGEGTLPLFVFVWWRRRAALGSGPGPGEQVLATVVLRVVAQGTVGSVIAPRRVIQRVRPIFLLIFHFRAAFLRLKIPRRPLHDFSVSAYHSCYH